MTFENLGLAAELMRAVKAQNYTRPTPIQAQAIPVVLEGRDVLAGAQTGTGKTAAFTLPLLQRLSQSSGGRSKAPRALVLTPTRELAAQVGESVRDLGAHLPLRSTVIFGGVNINPQIDKLRRGVDVLVATPGRLLDHAGQKTVDLSRVEILVLDEADRMLDMGFIHDIRKILARLPKQRQNLLFSATYSNEIKRLADGLLDNPALIEVARRNTAAETVTQRVHPVDKGRKRELLSHIIRENDWHQVLVFTRTKHGANRLAEQLGKDGVTAAAIHGNKSQGARTRALSGFKDGSIRTLVATDIAARGIDIEKLPYVVNFELPNVAEDYVHRIGRTGRAGAEGVALSLVSADEGALLGGIQKLIKRDLSLDAVAGFEPQESVVVGRGKPQRAQRPPRGGNRSTARSNGRSSTPNKAAGNHGGRNSARTASSRRHSSGNR